MKVKYEVSVESGFDVADRHPSYKIISGKTVFALNAMFDTN